MAENLSKKPAKGILKQSSSFDHTEVHKPVLGLKQQGKSAASSIAQPDNKDIKWDEMNILQTLHPPGKDYGHMKIEEPKTPYSYFKEGSDDVDGGRGSDNEGEGLDAELLAKKITLSSGKLPKALREEEESEEDENETEEERAKRKAFEYKRKMHYNEYYAVKLARKLMPNDEEDEDDEDDEKEKKGDNRDDAEKEVIDEKAKVEDVDV